MKRVIRSNSSSSGGNSSSIDLYLANRDLNLHSMIFQEISKYVKLRVLKTHY